MHSPSPASDAAPADFWEGFYASRDSVWSGRPNLVLTQQLESATPGRALDLGCGEGGDALWLASRGWQVTALDISSTALARGAEHARDAGVEASITWQQQDLASWRPTETYDLVSAHFLQSPVHLPADAILRSALTAVAPGGQLLVVSHASGPPSAEPRHDLHFPQPAEIVAGLDLDLSEFTVEVSEVRPRSITDATGAAVTVTDSVVIVRRLQLD